MPERLPRARRQVPTSGVRVESRMTERTGPMVAPRLFEPDGIEMSALPRVDHDVPPPRALRVLREGGRQRSLGTDICELVAKVLGCRRVSLMVAGLDGRLVVEDAIGFPPGLAS